MDNIVIKVLNKEHGKKVKEYFNSIGIKTGNFKFSVTEDDNCDYIYYGSIDGIFANYKLENLKSHVKIITLPEEKTFPREMLVSQDNTFKQPIRRIVLNCYKGEIKDTYIAVQYGYEKNFKEGNWFETTSWKYAKELPEESIKTPLQLEFEELQNKIKELQIKADEIKTKL